MATQKLLLAMIGHHFVKVFDDSEDPSKSVNSSNANTTVVKELLRLGKQYKEVISIIQYLRSQTENHNRFVEILLKCFEQELLDGYLARLCQCEQVCCSGKKLNILRIKWFVLPYIRAFPEVLTFLRKLKQDLVQNNHTAKIFRLLHDLNLSSSPLTEAITRKCIQNGLHVMKDSVIHWLLEGEIILQDQSYFFIQDHGNIRVLALPKSFHATHQTVRGMEDSVDMVAVLERFSVALERVPKEARLSLDWANQICFIGKVIYFLKQSNQSAKYLELRNMIMKHLTEKGKSTSLSSQTTKSSNPNVHRELESTHDTEAAGAPGKSSMDATLFDGLVPTRIALALSVSAPVNDDPTISHETLVDPFDEYAIQKLYEYADEVLKEYFCGEIPRTLVLFRDSFFLGRGELFRIAMDTLDFERACELSSSQDILNFVEWTPRKNILNFSSDIVMCNSVVKIDDRNRQIVTIGAAGWLTFQNKIQCGKQGFTLNLDAIQFPSIDEDVSPACSIFASSTQHYSSFTTASTFPSLVVEFKPTKITLYLDSLYTKDWRFDIPQQTYSNIALTHFLDDNFGGIRIEFTSENIKMAKCEFHFEDALIVPKWMDAHSRSYFGLFCSPKPTSEATEIILQVKKFAIVSTEEVAEDVNSLPSPCLSVPFYKAETPGLCILPYSLYEDANGAFQSLFRLKRSQELLAKAWAVCKQQHSLNSTLSCVRFSMAQVCTSIVYYFQFELVQVTFQDVLKQVQQGKDRVDVRFEYLQAYTRLSLERLISRCAFSNVAAKVALENVLVCCDSFSIKVLMNDSDFVSPDYIRQTHSEFENQVIGLLQVLTKTSSLNTIELVNLIDYTGYWSSKLGSIASSGQM
jgi:hypothetical protein